MSGVEAFGVVASAAQLADIGYSLVTALSRLCKKIHDYPEKLLRGQQSVRQLLETLDVVRSTSVLATTLIKTILDASIVDANTLLAILDPLAVEDRDGRAARYWKTICGLTRESRIFSLLEQLEERRITLMLCIGVVNSNLLHTVDQSILDLATGSQEAFRNIPQIQESLKHIAVQVEDLVSREPLTRSPSFVPAENMIRLHDVELALPRLDSKLDEVTELQTSLFQLTQSIQASLQNTSAVRRPDPPQPSVSFQDTFTTRSRSVSSTFSPSTNIKESAVMAMGEVDRHFFLPVNPNNLFTGREHIFRQIDDQFASNHGQQTRLVLTGLGGVGKTQIMTAYAYRSYASSSHSIVIGLAASDRETLVKTSNQAAKSLGLNARPPVEGEVDTVDSMPPLIDALLQWLCRERSRKWLLLFDNVDDLDSFDVSNFFPRVPWGHILITSRRRQAARLGQQIEIDVMGIDESVELLIRCSGLDGRCDDTAARRLADALGHLPLALDQAGAYISEQDLDFSTYLEIYQESREDLLRHRPPKAVWSYEETVFTTWEISFAAVLKSDPLAARILEIAAFFRYNEMPLVIIYELAQDLSSDKHLLLADFVDFITSRSDYVQLAGALDYACKASKFKIRQAIGRLVSLSLVRKKKQSYNLTIHPLVHFWLKERQSAEDRRKYARTAIGLSLRALINAYDLSEFGKAEIVHPHLFVCLEHIYAIPGLLSATELHKIGACIIAIDSWVPFPLVPGTLRQADRFYELVGECASSTEWTIPQPMLVMRQALRLKGLGLHAKCGEVCAHFFNHFEPKTRFDRIYCSCLARTTGPCLFRLGDYEGAEKAYSLIDDSLDPTGVTIARKQLVLAAMKIHRGLPAEAEAFLSSCSQSMLKGSGQPQFLVTVWHQLMSLCYIGQGRYDEAKATVTPHFEERLEKYTAGQIEFTFLDYELAEVIARIARKQHRFAEGTAFVLDLLGKTTSKVHTPARSICDLSLVLMRLEETLWKWETRATHDLQATLLAVEEATAKAHSCFERAAYAYEFEVNKGMWVFSNFHLVMQEYRIRSESIT